MSNYHATNADLLADLKRRREAAFTSAYVDSLVAVGTGRGKTRGARHAELDAETARRAAIDARTFMENNALDVAGLHSQAAYAFALYRAGHADAFQRSFPPWAAQRLAEAASEYPGLSLHYNPKDGVVYAVASAPPVGIGFELDPRDDSFSLGHGLVRDGNGNAHDALLVQGNRSGRVYYQGNDLRQARGVKAALEAGRTGHHGAPGGGSRKHNASPVSNFHTISDYHYNYTYMSANSGPYVVVDMLLDDGKHIEEMLTFEAIEVDTGFDRKGHTIRHAKMLVRLWDAPGRPLKTWWPTVVIDGERTWPDLDSAVKALLAAAGKLTYAQIRGQVNAWERRAQSSGRSPGTVTLVLPGSGTSRRAPAKPATAKRATAKPARRRKAAKANSRPAREKVFAPRTTAVTVTARDAASARSYSNGIFDLAQSVAYQLTDEDRAAGRPAPRHGYSSENFARAEEMIADASR